ncbi:MAG: hypothetical protein JWL67_1072 [Solirubrobacterales bacterium]|nr:hypothetical protein [Solirubrobacterales bacterium]
MVQYLYLHQPGDRFSYPSSRSSGNPARLAERYLECVLVQTASLRWAAPECELVLVSNLHGHDSLTRRGRALLDRILSFGVELLAAEYRHVPRQQVKHFHSSMYVLDAIQAVVADRQPDQQLWMVDVDCVWIDPQAAFAAVAGRTGISTLQIGYPADWRAPTFSREDLGAIGARLGPCDPTPPWIGGEALAGTAGDLRKLMEVCEQLDHELERFDTFLPTEEHVLTVAGGLGRLEFSNMSTVVGRIWTGRRHEATNPPDPAALAIWHLPSEKGLSLRRAANALLRGPAQSLRRDLSTPERAQRRFNVSGVRLTRSLRDDIWIAASRLRNTLLRRR